MQEQTSTPYDANALAHNGWVFLPAFMRGRSTEDVASRLGVIIDMRPLLAGYNSVQDLHPLAVGAKSRHHYSGVYGLGPFPLHTDFAHWAIPPRYLLLRCLYGTADVATTLLPWQALQSSVSAHTLKRAVLRARHRRGDSGLLRVLSHRGQYDIFRWDSIFLSAINASARTLHEIMQHGRYEREAIKITLTEPDDSLLIDNWRCMHGRTAVEAHSLHRHIQRIYLTEVFDDGSSR